MAGNKETLDFVKFVAELINGVDASRRDGKITWLDVTNFLKAALAAPDAFAGIKQLPAEFIDLDEQEKAEIIELFNATLKLDKPVTEEKVENIFDAALELAFAIEEALDKEV